MIGRGADAGDRGPTADRGPTGDSDPTGDRGPTGNGAPTAHRIRLDPDPTAAAHYSPGFRIGDLVVVSGQAALDEHGRTVGVGDFDAQAAQVFANLARVLGAAGSGLDQVVKVTIYLTAMAHFPKIEELRARHFTAPYPADTIVEVRALARPELLIEIEALALVGGTLVA